MKSVRQGGRMDWRSRWIGYVWLPLLVTCWLSGCGRQPVVASVDGEDITAEELVAEATQRGIPQNSAALQQVLEAIIDRNAAAVKAKDMDLADDPDFRRAYRNLALETLKNRYRLDWEQELTVSDAEIRADYEANPSRFTEPEKIRIALIMFEVGPQQTDSGSIAEDAFSRLQASPKGEARDLLFQTIAVNHSLDRGSRYRGGDVGILARGQQSQWPDDVQSAAFALAESGDISNVIDANGHQYLIKLASREPSQLQPLAAVRDVIRQRLLTARFDEVRQRVQHKLRENIPVKVYPEVLASLYNAKDNSVEPNQAPPGPALN